MPAVLVHGVPETPGVWDPMRKQLHRDDVIALQLPGFGCPRPAGFGATKEEYVAWLVGELEQIAAQGPIDLVGHDWGGGFTVRAREHARRPRALVGVRRSRHRERRLRVARLRQDLADAGRGREVLRRQPGAVPGRAGQLYAGVVRRARSTPRSSSTATSTRRWSTASSRCTGRRRTSARSGRPTSATSRKPGCVVIPSDDAFLDGRPQPRQRAPHGRHHGRARRARPLVDAPGPRARGRDARGVLGDPRLTRSRAASRRVSDAREVARRRDLRGRRADHDRDLLVIGQVDRARVAGAQPAVHEDGDRRRGLARGADAARVEPHSPLDEQLTERVVLVRRRLGVDDTADVVGVQRRDTRLLARRVDPAVAGRAGEFGNSVHTPGSWMLMPRPAGTVTCRPFRNTSRCACTWYSSCSAGSGTRPAVRARAIGSAGAGHTIGVGPGWPATRRRGSTPDCPTASPTTSTRLR